MSHLLLAMYLLIFGGWLVLSVVWQFPRVRDRAGPLSIGAEFRVWPIYTFFAPTPGMSDYHLLVRDRLPDGTTVDWRELEIVGPRRRYHFAWNPAKRRHKLLADALSEVKRVQQGVRESDAAADIAAAQVRLSQGYAILLNFACSVPAREGTVARQFLIAEATWKTGERELVPVLCSPFHALS